MSLDLAFGTSQPEREAALLPGLLEAVAHHRRHCPAYARVLAAVGHPAGRHYAALADLPWLPVRLFKQHALVSASASPADIVLTSSGTTSSSPSQVTLDPASALRQRQLLVGVLQSLTGAHRLPLLIIDSPAAVGGDRNTIRGATVLGVMQVGRQHAFALDTTGQIQPGVVAQFLRQYAAAPFLIFGFTSQVWTQLYAYAQQHHPDLSQALLLHTGGWKKLADQAVSPALFRSSFASVSGLQRCHNFYGMVEQGGTIHVESATGDGLYSPPYADVIIRDPVSWQPAATGCVGVIEVLSTAPRAHPGHILLTEDLGVIHGIDDGAWPGKRFSVLGRVPRAEARGCADTAPDIPAAAQP